MRIIIFWCENIFSEAFKWKMPLKSVTVLLEKKWKSENVLKKTLRSFWKKVKNVLNKCYGSSEKTRNSANVLKKRHGPFGKKWKSETVRKKSCRLQKVLDLDDNSVLGGFCDRWLRIKNLIIESPNHKRALMRENR